MIDRRDLLILFGAVALAPRVMGAQSKQPVVIGLLFSGSRETDREFLAAFKEGLSALGWKEGSGVVFEERWADGRLDRIPGLAEDLAAKKPALVFAAPAYAAAAAAKAAPKTPVVVLTGDPVASGLAKSYSRPDGTITGLSNFNPVISEKFLELLLGAAPKSRRVGFLFDTTASAIAMHKENAQRSAAQHSVQAQFAEAGRREEIEPALSRLAKEGTQALIVMPGVVGRLERRHIVKFALAQRWPVIAARREWVEDGALLSYGVDQLERHRRAAYYVDRILKGAKPGDLPIEQATKFELVVNLKTAKAIGLIIPQDFLFRADKVIE